MDTDLLHEGKDPRGLPHKSTLISETCSGVEPQREANVCHEGPCPEATRGYSGNSKTELIGPDFLFFVSVIERQIDDSAFDMGNFYFFIMLFFSYS